MEALYREHEKLKDAIEHNRLQPKQIDGMNTTLKGMRYLGIEVPLRLMSLAEKMKGKDKLADAMKDMRAPMIRTVLGLPEVAGR